jgi:dihydrofolate reductase
MSDVSADNAATGDSATDSAVADATSVANADNVAADTESVESADSADVAASSRVATATGFADCIPEDKLMTIDEFVDKMTTLTGHCRDNGDIDAIADRQRVRQCADDRVPTRLAAVDDNRETAPAQSPAQPSSKFALILAVDEQNGIGRNGTLPWRLPAEMRRFRKITTGAGRNAVIMGRATYESIPQRPLPNRHNIVLTSRAAGTADRNPAGVAVAADNKTQISDVRVGDTTATNVTFVDSFHRALEVAEEYEQTFVIGGARVFAEAMAHPNCDCIILTRIRRRYDCDTFAPQVDTDRFEIVEKSEPQLEGDIEYEFVTYRARKTIRESRFPTD